ncbi:MAG: hypothetical protein ABL874_05820 [Sphingopyxis sp.]
MLARNPWLIAAAWGSIAASLLHIGCIIGGPDWYRFFGAGEDMARMAERGHWYPPIITLFIAGVLAVWALFAFSAAGTLRRLPLARTALVAIAAVLLARSALGFVPSLWAPEQWPAFAIWSSLIVLALGLCFAIGTWKAWPTLSSRGV